jgi:hypothetical protein
MQVHEQLEGLVSTFEGDIDLAKQLQSPNPVDELPIKVAIVGFSYNSPTDKWALDHYNVLKDRLDGEYSLDNLREYAPTSRKIQLFAALCFGYLLGLYEADKVTDEEFRLAEAQIPGLIALKSDVLMS